MSSVLCKDHDDDSNANLMMTISEIGNIYGLTVLFMNYILFDYVY